MYKVSLEIPEQTTVNGLSKYMSFKSAEFNDYTAAMNLFLKTKSVIEALHIRDCYVNLYYRGKVIMWVNP